MAASSLIPPAVVIAATLLAAVTDIRKFKVYNVLTLPLLASGLVYHGLAGGGAGLGASLMGALFGFGSLLFVYILGGMGAGDVKLMAAVGAWLGLPLTFYVLVASSLAAGLFAVGLLLVARNLSETWFNVQLLAIRLMTISRHVGAEGVIEGGVKGRGSRRLIPFAAMIAVGVISTYVWLYQRG